MQTPAWRVVPGMCPPAAGEPHALWEEQGQLEGQVASTQGFRPPEPSGLTCSVPLCACRHVGTGSGQTPSGGHKVRIHNEEPEPLQEGWKPQGDLTQRAWQRVPAPGTGASEDPSPCPGPDSSTLVCGSRASAPGAGPPAAGTGQSSVRESHRKGNTRTPTPGACPAFRVSGDTPRPAGSEET